MTASRKPDIVFLWSAMSAESGMTAQIMKTEKLPRRPAVQWRSAWFIR